MSAQPSQPILVKRYARSRLYDAADQRYVTLWQMSRVVLSILRQAAEPLTSRDIALELLVSRAMDKRDQRLLRLMTKRVGVALRLQRDNGAVVAQPGPGQFVLWEIAR